MIYSLTGKIIKKTLNAVVVSCGGVGYYVQCPTSVAGALPGVGREATLYTVMSVTENDVSLYGFATEEQQACFEMLTAVSGVGPKAALSILSATTPQQLAMAVVMGDEKALTAAQGVGKKIAQRIVLELRDKLAKEQPEMNWTPVNIPAAGGEPVQGDKASEAGAALAVLGYGPAEINLALKGLDLAALSLEDIVRQALKKMLK